jgi:uncharacterized protein (AIM24 family)
MNQPMMQPPGFGQQAMPAPGIPTPGGMPGPPGAGSAVPPGQPRMTLQGSKMAVVAMQAGQDVYARTGSMVAYEGFIQYQPNPPALAQRIRERVTGEGVPLMLCQGDGLLYLADYGADVLLLQLNNEKLSINGTNVLALDTQLSFEIEKVKGLAKISGQGLFNVAIAGTGWVAVTTRGTPVVLNCGEEETAVDPDALVAWTTDLKIKPRRSVRASALIGRGSGEAFQLGFKGQGFVVVQPSEDSSDRFRIRG